MICRHCQLVEMERVRREGETNLYRCPNTEDDGTANSGGQSANTNAKSAHEGRIAGGAY